MSFNNALRHFCGLYLVQSYFIYFSNLNLIKIPHFCFFMVGLWRNKALNNGVYGVSGETDLIYGTNTLVQTQTPAPERVYGLKVFVSTI